MAITQERNSNNLASLDKRFIGQFLDGLISWSIFLGIFSSLNNFIDGGATLYIASGLSLLYFLFSDAFAGGQSVGKKIAKIKVVKKGTEKPCSIVQSFFRNITFPLGLIDWVSIFFSSRRRLGDFIANTEVINR